MSNLASVSRLALLALVASTGLAAQEGWNGSLKLGAGPTNSGAKTVMGNAGYSFAPQVELAYGFNKKQSLVLGLGFRFFPGDIATVSYIPGARPVTTTPTAYEARLRKPDAKGTEFTALYRQTMGSDFFVQGGMRLGLYKVNFRDTGSRITYATNGTTITNIDTIMDDVDKKTVSFGLMAGFGYRLTENFSLEANVFTVRLGDPLGSTSTSLVSEIAFGIRF